MIRPNRAFAWCTSLALALLTFTAGATQTAPPLKIGLHPYLSPRNLLATYEPMRQHLEQQLKRPIQIYTAPDMQSLYARARTNEYDLVLLAPHMARLAQTDQVIRPIAIAKQTITAYFVAPTSSNIQAIGELRGGTLAIPDPLALAVIRGIHWLSDQGLIAQRDYHLIQTTSHSSAAQSLLSGEANLALMAGPAYLQMPEATREATRIFLNFAELPGLTWGVAARISTAEEESLRRALFSFEQTPAGRKFFDDSNQGGLRRPTVQDWAVLDRDAAELKKRLADR